MKTATKTKRYHHQVSLGTIKADSLEEATAKAKQRQADMRDDDEQLAQLRELLGGEPGLTGIPDDFDDEGDGD